MDVVVITGAGRGIGRAIAEDLGCAGWSVLCISRSERALQTARRIEDNGGRAKGLVLDLERYDAVGPALQQYLDRNGSGRIRIVLAAGELGPGGDDAFSQLEGWDRCWRVNVLGNLAVVSALLPRMLEDRFGRIVAFSGGGAAYAYPLFPAYSATKTAVVRTMENLHEYLAPKGDFATVCLAPGAVETDMLDKVRNAGAEVKTTVAIDEPVAFVREFLQARTCAFSGTLVHVRNNWRSYLDTAEALPSAVFWKLRRIE